MSLALVSNPVETVGGVVQNIFAGFLPVNFVFKREDLAIQSLGLGVGVSIRVTISSDLTTILSVGDFLYLSAVGDTTGFEYEQSGEITAITATTIDLDIDFIENSTVGYINYLKNYFVETELVNPDNSAINLLRFSLKTDGDLAGNVIVDVSIANDKNNQFFEFVSQEMTESRLPLKMQYRQVYDNSSESFTLIDTEIVLVFATKQPDYESFLNDLDEAYLYKGYPFGVILSHTRDNNDDDALNTYYDELDINQSDITTDNPILQFDSDKQGFLFVNIDKDISYDSETEYIRLTADYSALAFFDNTFFDNTFFETD